MLTARHGHQTAHTTGCWRAGAAEVKRLFEDLGHPLTDQKLFDVMERFDAAGTVQFFQRYPCGIFMQLVASFVRRPGSHEAT